MTISIKRLAEEARTAQERFTDLRAQWFLQGADGALAADAAPLFDAGGGWDRLA